MSVRDAGFLYLEQPHCPIHIGCVTVLEGEARLGDLASRTEAELMGVKNFGATSLVEVQEKLQDFNLELRTLE